jgi:DNA-binding CsgD family transcriptional regulator/tetratricopeptide (TPR) repeat protein
MGAGPSSEPIGREVELSTLAQVVARTTSGSGRLVLVTGAAGTGKTTLVAQALRGDGLKSVHVAASPLATIPMAPLVAVLCSLRRQRPQAFAQAHERWPALGSLMPELAPMPDGAGTQRILEVVIDTLVHLARVDPVALVFDDLQWADDATLDLLARIATAAESAPLLVIGICSSDSPVQVQGMRTLRHQLRRARRLCEITLGPLAESDIARLAVTITGAPIDPRTLRRLFVASGGVPFYAAALAETLLLADRIDRSRAGALERYPLALRDAVLGRFDRLPDDGRAAAEVAAVLGAEFSLGMLASTATASGIAALLDSGLAVELPEGNATFRPALVQEVLYSAMPWTRRSALHRSTATALDAAGQDPERSAAHWRACGEPARACDRLLEAAARSRGRHLYREAMQRLQQALDGWPPGHDESLRLSALEQLAEVAQSSGHDAVALKAWREVSEAAREPRERARGFRRLAHLHELSCDFPRSLTARLEARSAFAAAGDHAEAAIEGIAAAGRLRQSSQHRAALEMLVRAREDADSSGRRDLRVRVAALTANLEVRLGNVGDGIAAIRSALAEALDMDQPELVGETYQRLADALERSSDFQAATAVNRKGIGFCEERTAPGGLLACMVCMSWILVRSGQWTEAARTSRRLAALPAPVARGAGIVHLGLISALRGDVRRAETLLVEGQVLARRLGHAALLVNGTWGSAMHAVCRGDLSRAADCCRDLVARVRATDERHACIPALRWSASCLAKAGDKAGLIECAALLRDAVARFDGAEPLSALAHAMGELAWMEDDVDRASAQFEHAVTLIDAAQLPRERIESELRAAAALAAIDRREDAVAYARSASRACARLGSRTLDVEATALLKSFGETRPDTPAPRTGRHADRAGLTVRQLQIVGEIAKGLTDKQVARGLALSPRTVETHVSKALEALQARTRAEAVHKATQLGLLPPT